MAHEDPMLGGNITVNATESGLLRAIVSLLNDECASYPEFRSQDVLFHCANALFLVSYIVPYTKYGQIVLHAGLIIGFLIFSTWAWNIICAPDVFAWYFGFMILNMGQLLYILYQMRPIKFDTDLENVYETLFQPMRVTRAQFEKLIGSESAQLCPMHTGECYAIADMTRTDRLGLLVTGRAQVLNDRTLLHQVGPGEFLDSPEFESSVPNTEQTFKVTVCAMVPSKYIVWDRKTLEYLFVKEPYLATVMQAIISQDIAKKLFAMNSRIKLPDGSNLDIRLPGLAGRLSEMDPRDMAKFVAATRDHRGALATQDDTNGNRRSDKQVRFR